MLRWLTAGESHGPALVAVLEGLPAGVRVTTSEVADALARRRAGYGRGARMSFERDEVEFLGGVRHGVSMGGPVAIKVGNTEWPKWEKVMAGDPVDPDELAELARNAPLTRPRPGHADLVGMQKYALDDVRPVLERASARETAARVALGKVARNFLKQALDYEIARQVALIESGGRVVQETRLYNPEVGETFSMRSKESAHDYRYFPEPDLVPLRVSEERLSMAVAASVCPRGRAMMAPRQISET